MRLNPAFDPAAVPPPSLAASAFHASMRGYRPTPVHRIAPDVLVKDESDRFGLPAFKILGASWAVERALRDADGVRELVAASAGNHGRAVARVARLRGLGCRVFLPARSLPARRDAIADEGAEVVVVDGTYEDAVVEAAAVGLHAGVLEVADVGTSRTAHWVIDGYATLFAEAGSQAEFRTLLVPVGVEPVTAACLDASLAAGEPVAVLTPGTAMAGLDCAEVSAAAWPSLQAGIYATVTVDDAQAAAAVRTLDAAGLRIGESGAAPLAALDQLDVDGPVLLVATEGRTA